MSAQTRVDFFWTWSYNTVLCYLLLHQSWQLWPFESLQVGACIPLTCPHPGVIWALPRCFDTTGCSGSSYIFPDPVLECAMSPRSPGAFYWRTEFRNQDTDSEIASRSWNVPASRPPHLTELGNVCMDANSRVHTNLSLLWYPSIGIYTKLNLSSPGRLWP